MGLHQHKQYRRYFTFLDKDEIFGTQAVIKLLQDDEN